MIQQKWNSNNQRFCLYVTVKCKGEKSFRVVANDLGKKHSKYADRIIKILSSDNGERHIYLSFSVSPKMLMVTVYDIKDEKGTDFEVTLKEGTMRPSTAWLDNETRSFVQMAIIFSQKAGFTTPESPFTLYQSSDDLYKIKYFDVIKDISTEKPMSTPARIGHSTGIIEVSKVKFDNYTIPMRMIILLHEFSHKYKNPKMGLDIGNETGADINGLYIYLSLGFSKIDAIYVFANVFFKAQTEQNRKRMRVISDYIKKFEAEQNEIAV